MKKLILPISCLLICLFFMTVCSPKPEENIDIMILNVPKVLNKTEAEVEKKLGEPDSIFSSAGARANMANVYHYNNQEIDIFFYNGISKEVLISAPDTTRLKFNYEFPKWLGIYPDIAPDYIIEDNVISWGNLPDYQEVKLFTQTPYDSITGIWDYKVFVVAK